jgi:membrane protein YqaA with SNARE-associated domain
LLKPLATWQDPPRRKRLEEFSMAQLLPPPPPTILVGDDDNRQRLLFRQWQLLMSTLTLMATVWLTTFGKPLLTILAWVVAKHIWVAILMMGLHRYPRYKDESETPRTCQ